MYEINNPTPEPLFYIAFNNDNPPVVHHGKIYTVNQTTIGMNPVTVETFSVADPEYNTAEEAEAAYWLRLEDFGIYPESV